METTKKKNQHYVPKCYLKQFSFEKNNVEIGMYNFKNALYKERVPIRPQASEDFFYGKDGQVEDWLELTERHVAPILKRIIKENSIEFLNGNNEQQPLILFIALLLFRTKGAIDEYQELADNTFQQMLEYDERMKNLPKGLHLVLKQPFNFILGSIFEGYNILLDLKLKLIVNQSSKAFICSDNPVVKYNQFLEERNYQFLQTGILSKGLQILLPISPNHLLICYDEWAYKVGNRAQTSVILNDTNDIDQLNYLQMLNCNNQIFFDDKISLSSITSLVSKAVLTRSIERKYIKLFGTISDNSKNLKLFSCRESINIKLSMSFIKQTKKAKTHILNDYINQLRNENLRHVQRGGFMRRSRFNDSDPRKHSA